MVQVEVLKISYHPPSKGYAVILKELEGNREFPLIVGSNEAQSIAMAIENIEMPRPLTHDLFKSFCERFDIIVKQVIIHKLVDGVFYSSIICDRDGIEEIIDSRTSDAIALATRFDAPIFTYENILEKAGIIIEIEEYDEEDKILFKELFSEETTLANSEDFKDKTIGELQKLLKIAVQNENYETAAKIRDEISNR